MKGTIKRRVQDLETTLARSVETAKDTLADAIRARLRGLAKFVGKESAAQAERYLDELGPEEFTKQTIKGVLQGHGYERRPNESLAETMARAMGITSSELKARLQRGEGFNLPAPEVPETPVDNANSPPRTVIRRRKEAKFAEVMERGRAKGRISVRRAQMRLLEQGNATMGVWLGKQLLGQTDQPANEDQPRPAPWLSLAEIEEKLRPYLAKYPHLIPEYEAVNAQYAVVEPSYRSRARNQATEPKDAATPGERSDGDGPGENQSG